MPSGPQSGKFGVVHANQVACSTVANWNINFSDQSEMIMASNTKFGPFRQSSIEDWTGSFLQYQGLPCVWPGDVFLFEGFTAPETGVYGNNGWMYYGDAIVDTVVITLSWQPSMSINTVVNFSAVDCLGSRNDIAIDDTLCNLPDRMCLLDVLYTDPGNDPTTQDNWVSYPNIQQAILTLASGNVPYSNSSTGCCTGRRSGGFDWNLAIVEEETAATWLTGKRLGFRVLVDNLTGAAPYYYQLKWGKLDGYAGPIVDRETNEIIRKTASWSMTGMWRYFDDPTWKCEYGSVYTPNPADPPNPTLFWPPVATPSP